MPLDNKSELSVDKAKILIVDTDSMSSELLQFRFESEGFQAVIISSGEKALESDLSGYSLIIVDLMDQELNGVKFTRMIKCRPDSFNIPVIMLSKKSSEDDVVEGLDAGADDYISKPFSSRELIARVRSVVRRRRMMSLRRAANAVRVDGLVLDLSAGRVTIDGEPVMLTRTEYLILAMFMRNRNSFFDRSEIRHEAWEDENGVSDRAFDTNISRLRKKLGDYGRNIVNRQGFGYGFVD